MRNQTNPNESASGVPARLLRVSEFARALGYTTGYVYLLIHEGRISAIRIGESRRTIRIPETELARFIGEGSRSTLNTGPAVTK